jgi:hypothetical protein
MRQQIFESWSNKHASGCEEHLAPDRRFIGVCIADEYAVMFTGSGASIEPVGSLAFNIGGSSSGLSPNLFCQRFDSRLSLVVHWINATLSCATYDVPCELYIGAMRPLDAAFARQIRHDFVQIIPLPRSEIDDESLGFFYGKILELQNGNAERPVNPLIA